MSEVDPIAQGPSPAELAPPLSEATQARIGNVAIGQEQLIDPSVTLTTLDAMLAKPDKRGRVLPQIDFDQTDVEELGSGVTSVTDRVRNSEGGVVGVAQVSITETEQSEFFTQVTALERRKGYGPAIYLNSIKKALERGNDFRTDPAEQSADAVRVWEDLEEAGVAMKVTEFEKIPGHDTFRGYYVVNGNNRPKVLPIEKEKLVVKL